jgi:hypothetical protein
MRSRLATWLPAALVALGLALPAWAQRETYNGHQTVRVLVETEAQWQALRGLTDDIWSPDNLSTDAVWGESVGPGSVDARIQPHNLAGLAGWGLSYEVLIPDVGALIASQQPPAGALRGTFDYTQYHPLSDIDAKITALAQANSNIAQVVTVGMSLENRPIRGLRITGPGDATNRPGFLFHGGQHAREWINVPVPMYAAEWLLNNYGSDPLAARLVNEVEWFIIPVMNPDGYSFSWTDQRLWRKNRRPNAGGSFGVDLNRNWGFAWGEAGASSSPSSETYRGTAAFSEPETQAMRDFIIARPNIAAYIDYHSYSQLVMWPFGPTATPPEHEATFSTVVNAAVARMRAVHDFRHVTGTVFDTIYQTSGGSIDWVYGANLPGRNIFAITFELRDKGQTGFLLPADQILATCEENLPAILLIAEWLAADLRIDTTVDPPVHVGVGETFAVTVSVVDHADTVADDGVTLLHRVAGETTFAETPMIANGDGTYTGIIAPSGCRQDVEWYVRASSDAGRETYFPLDAPAALGEVRVGSDVLYYDNVEVDTGWNTGVTGDSATQGRWERSDPIGTHAQPSDDRTPGAGRSCFVTDGRASFSGGVGAYDVDSGTTTLRSPVINLAGTDPMISLWYWYSNDQGSAPNADDMPVQVSNDGGSNWTTVTAISTNTLRWERLEFRLADFVAPTSQVRLRLLARDLNTGSIVEAAVDDILIESAVCGPIDGDANGDGLITPVDVNSFAACMNGPAGGGVAAGCGVFNFDLDTDVDLLDWAALQRGVVP